MRGAGQGSTLIGIALMIGAVAGFACIDASAKFLNREMSTPLIVAARYVGSLLVVSAVLAPRAHAGLLRTRRPLLQVLRSLCLVAATLCTVVALRYLPLAQVTSITFASPLVVALIAGPLLGETVGWRRTAAVLVGFCGVLIVSRPGLGGLHPAAGLAGVTACANGLYIVVTRLLASHDPPETTMLYTSLVGSVLMLPLLPFIWEAPSDPWLWVGIGAIGFFGALGHWLLILAHRHAPASTLAPFAYAHLLWAVLLGFVVFHDLPDRWTLLGGAVVAASGLYLLSRERRPARR
ncbi:DMT family transporter [Methylobacterium isbiliense]|uniref:Riboflavin transporter n=1 Tax=Methylobacterium isbiliense TaxID=315478 RepID=A0ABQ4S9G1_9HYPH|nr:DMT family transporter [Methylobacterium isbiliense]MDN3627173.1 DMT family transporter [Methylobacterium isbiliense]GJD99022.1 Riboflavin transporter [Methylobacterium isbiliense]